ncbi:MAG: hypothetical protein KA144_15425, partial [Xanthomonadaceae bacterium]|nr:hypothetical protein [Xanthomonadaceae bacterium]
MRFRMRLPLRAALAAILSIAAAITAQAVESGADTPTFRPSEWTRIARIDPRYLSFNIEMAAITGGEFWAPYDDPQRRRYAPRAPADLGD